MVLPRGRDIQIRDTVKQLFEVVSVFLYSYDIVTKEIEVCAGDEFWISTVFVYLPFSFIKDKKIKVTFT